LAFTSAEKTVIGIFLVVTAMVLYGVFSGYGYARACVDRNQAQNVKSDAEQAGRRRCGSSGRFIGHAVRWYFSDSQHFYGQSNRSGSIDGTNRLTGGPGYGK
jgi:hypothetical protein